MKCGSGTSHLWKSWQDKCGKRNFRSLPVKAERKCRSRFSHIWRSRQSGSAEARPYFWQSMQNESADVELQIFGSKDRAEAELQIFGSQGRTEVRNRNIRSWHSRQSRSVEAKFQTFEPSRQSGSAEAAMEIFDRQIKLDVRKQILTSLTGQYPSDCHCQC